MCPVPLSSRPLSCLLLFLVSGALALSLLQSRSLGGDSGSGNVVLSSPSLPTLHPQPSDNFRPQQSETGDYQANEQSAVLLRYEPWVSPLASVHEWPPASATISTYRWQSHHTPLWQKVVERKGQTVDLASVGVRNGRIVFYGLSEQHKAEIRAHFEPFKHFDGGSTLYDRVEDVTEFVDEPLDWSQCTAVQPNYTFFLTPWMPMLFYHVVCDHLIRSYANLRSANALPQRLQLTFHSSELALSHPRSLFHTPLPAFQTAPSTLSPFTSSHLTNGSHSALYVYTRYHAVDRSAAMSLLYQLYEGDVHPFSELESTSLTCFRRIRWGRGVPLHYFSRVFPFPLPASAPVWNSSIDTYMPAAAARVAKEQLDLYTDIELGRWAGIVIDFHNFIVHMLGRDRRVRAERNSATHEPHALSEVAADVSPRILLITRGRQQGRFIANRDCLFTAFAAASLTLTSCCEWQDPLTSIVASFQSADVLVGLHGAGFTNLLWMAPGGVVIEITTHHNPDNNYFGPLSQHMDHSHIAVDGRAHHRGDEGYHFTPAFCAQLANLTWHAWQYKHSSRGRFSNVYASATTPSSG